MTHLTRAIATLTLLLMGLTGAIAETDLYSGDVIVASQSEVDRNEALPVALSQVLQKLTGLGQLPATEVLEDSLMAASNYLLSYRYQSVEHLDPQGDTVRKLHLIARFLPEEVDKLVQSSELPRWPQQRPAVQIWVVVDNGLGRVLKPLEYEFAWQATEQAAADRGLPIVWPDLDDEEIQLIDTSLVWGGFTDYLIEKGAPPDGVAIVAAGRSGPYWNLRWALTSEQQNWNWVSSDTQLSSAMTSGIQQMVDNLAAANAIKASDQGQWTHNIAVTNLLSAADYARCLNYLQEMSLITDVEIMGAEPGLVRFRLQLNASPDYLTEAFTRGSVLLPSSPGSRNDFEYLR